jgi:hypothetical protein
VLRLDNVDALTVRSVLGTARETCPHELTYLRGIPAFDGLVRREAQRVRLDIRGTGTTLCLVAAAKDPFVGLLDESIAWIEMEDLNQIYERRRGDVVADSLIGLVTGGVRGALMRGASGMKEREVPVEMPDLVVTLMHRQPEGGEHAVHLALGFGAKEEVAEFFAGQFGERFRLVATQRARKQR